MAEEFDRKELENWLKTQPREVSIAIAARAALRVLPVLSKEYAVAARLRKINTIAGDIVLPVFRATALPLAAAKYPARGNELRAAADSAAAAADSAAFAADSAAFAADSAADSAAYAAAAYAAAYAAAAFAAAYAADSAAAAADSAAFAADSAAAAADSAARAADSAAAAAALDADIDFINRGGKSEVLAGQPLWAGGTPGGISSLWNDLQSRLTSHRSGWHVWIRWYQALLDGKSTPGGEELDIYRVLLRGEQDWEESPTYVNRLIREKEKEIAGRKEAPLSPQDLLQYPASFVFDFIDGKLAAKPVTGGDKELSDADDMRQDLVGKLRKAAARLERTQCVPRYPETMRRAADLLEAQSAADLPAGKVLMAFRSLEADAMAITSPEGRNEIAADGVALVEDAWRSFEDFKAQLPNVIKLETNRMALHLATGDAAAVNAEIERLNVSVTKSSILASSATEALAEGREEFEHYQQTIQVSHNTMEIAAAKEAQAAIVAQRSMVVRNLVARPLKFVADKTVAGIGSGIEKSAEAITISGIAALMGYIAGPVMGIAVFIASFRPLAKRAEDVSKTELPDDMAET